MAGQPVYATPVRVIGQSGGHGAGNLSANGHADYEQQQQHTVPYPDYGGTSRSGMRSLKMKSQNSTGTNRQANLSAAHHGLHYPSYAMVG